jgi:hypothetical protein
MEQDLLVFINRRTKERLNLCGLGHRFAFGLDKPERVSVAHAGVRWASVRPL